MRRVWPLAAVVAAALAGCGGGDGEKLDRPLPAAAGRLALTSPAIAADGTLPRRFTCDGAGTSPPLAWSGVPRGTRELVLLVTDPDAGGFVHWALAGIPPRTRMIDAGHAPAGATQLRNSFGDRGWGAACPPKSDAPHRYVFTLYATGAPLHLDPDATPDDLRGALAGHALARGTLTARYGRG